jgi:hypothetical protein
VESFFNHFAAEEPRKDGHAGEEDAQTEIVELDDVRQNLRILFDLGPSRVEDGMGQDDERRSRSENVDPNSAACKQVSPNFVAHQDGDLACIEPPRLFLRPLLGARD